MMKRGIQYLHPDIIKMVDGHFVSSGQYDGELRQYLWKIIFIFFYYSLTLFTLETAQGDQTRVLCKNKYSLLIP